MERRIYLIAFFKKKEESVRTSVPEGKKTPSCSMFLDEGLRGKSN